MRIDRKLIAKVARIYLAFLLAMFLPLTLKDFSGKYRYSRKKTIICARKLIVILNIKIKSVFNFYLKKKMF